MNELRKLSNINLSKDQIEQSMNQLIKLKINNDLKTRYAEILEEEYGVTREGNTSQATAFAKDRPTSRSSRFKIALFTLLGILSVSVAYLAGRSLGAKNAAPEEKVHIYLADNSIRYNGVSRSDASGIDAQKMAAYTAFNKKDFAQAQSKLEALSVLTLEDEFYLSCAKMHQGAYHKAVAGFDKHISKKGKYSEEAKLYKALCLSVTYRDAFGQLVSSMDKNAWAYKQLLKSGLIK